MSNDDLKSFKISDQVKKPVDRPRSPNSAESEPAPSSAGFPRIEALVETEDPTQMQSLQQNHERLEEMAKSGASNKEKAAAKKAAAAYAKARGLVGYLLETKAKLAGK